MKLLFRISRFEFFLVFCTILGACEKMSQEDFYNPNATVSNNFIRTYIERTKGKSQVFVMKEYGKLNAIKKAYQLTDFPFKPVGVIENNIGSYVPGVDYKGMIYSSTKEIGNSVGNNVSFYTFATAVRNPRSKLYTEHIDELPYHGVNCRAYYGTVCSSLVSYALGLSDYGSWDFIDSELMEEIVYNAPEEVEVADVLWLESHVALITDIHKSDDGKIKMVEISEAVLQGCIRTQYGRDSFDQLMCNHYKKLIRYKFIEDNTEYKAYPSIVPVAGEMPVPMSYNNDLCVDKGDRSNYLAGEDVTINTFSPYDSVVVYKDYERFLSIVPTEKQIDITLKGLPYGTYNAYLWANKEMSRETSWIVVDYDVSFDLKSRLVSFRSRNSSPKSVRLCSIVGSRSRSAQKLFYRELTNEEQLAGRVVIPADRILDDYRCIQVKFNTEYGVVSTWPIKPEN